METNGKFYLVRDVKTDKALLYDPDDLTTPHARIQPHYPIPRR